MYLRDNGPYFHLMVKSKDSPSTLATDFVIFLVKKINLCRRFMSFYLSFNLDFNHEMRIRPNTY